MLEKRSIKDYENYLIDTEGNIYNTTTNKPLKGSISEHGYKYYRLSKDGKKKMFYAHRLVAEMFLSNPNNFTIVNHIAEFPSTKEAARQLNLDSSTISKVCRNPWRFYF